MTHKETTAWLPSHWLSVTIALGMSAFVLVDDSSDQAGYSGGVERSESLVKCIS